MSRRIIGLTVEYKQALIFAKGYVSETGQCEEEPQGCCGDDGGGLTGSGIGSANCCSQTSPNAEVPFSLTGPILVECAPGSMTGSVNLGDGEIWGGSGDFGTLIAHLELSLYCVGGDWFISGNLTPPDADPFFFDIPLIVDPTTGTLVGSITRPGCEEPIVIAFDPPCSGAVSWNCDEGVCVAVAGSGGAYVSQEACAAACGASYNCVEGECVEVVGTGGTYPDIFTCLSNCTIPTVSVPCCPSPVAQTLPFTVTGCVSVAGTTGTVVWNGTRWEGVAVISCGTAEKIFVWAECDGGQITGGWQLQNADGSPSNTACVIGPSFPTRQCSPFLVIITKNCGSAGPPPAGDNCCYLSSITVSIG